MKTIQPPQSNRPPLPDPTQDVPTLASPTQNAAHGSSQSARQAASANVSSMQHQPFTLHLPGQTEPATPEQAQTTIAQDQSHNRRTAAEVIRTKIQRLYEQEPSAQQEISAISSGSGAYSKHQEFVMRLVDTGQPLADIQTAWHAYYASLPDNEKHEVWQEFYANYERASKFAQALMGNDTQPDTTASSMQPTAPDRQQMPASASTSQNHTRPHTTPPEPIRPYQMSPADKSRRKSNELQTIAALRSQILAKVAGRSKLAKSSHIRSLAFGLAAGSVFLLIFLFSFFNERFVTPFIMPGKATASTKLILDPNQNSDVGPEQKIIIPKLNVEVPVVYNTESIEEKAIQQSLEGGVVHYPITEKPGELGNGVIVGHSSNNILNKGKYKFAFLMLKKLEVGDTFYVHFDSKRYVYRIYESRIVEPTDVSVLEDTDRPATMTLITCDPPGTSIKRLIVRGEQISPEPSSNIASSAVQLPEAPAVVPGNAPTLFQRLTDWIF